MFKPITALALAATVLPLAAAPVQAQSAEREYRRDVRDARREYREDVRDARRDYRRDARRDEGRRDRGRDWRDYRGYDYNRFENGQRGYYADRYYRNGNYAERRLGRNDRIYRGSNGRYYCRRNDGTTGLILGGAAGGLLGNLVTNGNSSLLGTLIGAGGGALLGRSIDRGNVRCR